MSAATAAAIYGIDISGVELRQHGDEWTATLHALGVYHKAVGASEAEARIRLVSLIRSTQNEIAQAARRREQLRCMSKQCRNKKHEACANGDCRCACHDSCGCVPVRLK